MNLAEELVGIMLEVQERVVAAAVCVNGHRIYRGLTHSQARQVALSTDMHHPKDVEAAEDGFWTNFGRYVDRDEAYRIQTGKKHGSLFCGTAKVVATLLESPRFPTLKAGRRSLDPEEKKAAVAAGGCWSDGKCAIWKATVGSKTWYCSNTHRTYACDTTIKQAAKSFKNRVKPSA